MPFDNTGVSLVFNEVNYLLTIFSELVPGTYSPVLCVYVSAYLASTNKKRCTSFARIFLEFSEFFFPRPSGLKG